MTLDLGTTGYYNHVQIYNIFNAALNRKNIGQFRVSPEGAKFRPLSGRSRLLHDEVKCQGQMSRSIVKVILRAFYIKFISNMENVVYLITTFYPKHTYENREGILWYFSPSNPFLSNLICLI